MNQLCIKQGALGCEQFIYADPTMNGGGPFFIEEFLMFEDGLPLDAADGLGDAGQLGLVVAAEVLEG